MTRRVQDRDFRDDYRERHPFCEVCHVLHGLAVDGAEVHHVNGGTSGRHDLEWNLVHLCKGCHDFSHARPIEGRVQALYVKFAAVVRRMADEFRQSHGAGVRLEGWLDQDKTRAACADTSLERMRLALLTALEAE